MLNKTQDNLATQALEFNAEGKGVTGRPSGTWKTNRNKELEQLKTAWKEAKKVAKNEGKWREIIEEIATKGDEQE